MTSETELAIEPEIEPATAEIIALPTAARPPAEPDQLAGLARKIGDLLGRVNEIGARYHTEACEAWTAALATHARTLEDIKSREAAETKDLRLEAGRLLIEAKALVPQGGWSAWLEANVKRNRTDCYACMKMAGAENPGRERAKEKANTRERVQKHREGKRAAAAAVAATSAELSVTSTPVTDTIAHQARAAAIPQDDVVAETIPTADAPSGEDEDHFWGLIDAYKNLSPKKQDTFRNVTGLRIASEPPSIEAAEDFEGLAEEFFEKAESILPGESRGKILADLYFLQDEGERGTFCIYTSDDFREHDTMPIMFCAVDGTVFPFGDVERIVLDADGAKSEDGGNATVVFYSGDANARVAFDKRALSRIPGGISVTRENEAEPVEPEAAEASEAAE